MDILVDLKERVQTLSPQQFAEFRVWVLEQDSQAWDDKISQDQSGGVLEQMVSDAREDYRTGKLREL